MSGEVLQTIGKTCPKSPTASQLSLADGLFLNTGFRDPVAQFIRNTFVIAQGAGVSEDTIWALYGQWHADQTAAPKLSRWNVLHAMHEALRGTGAMRSPSIVVEPPAPGFMNLAVKTVGTANVAAFNPGRKANNT